MTKHQIFFLISAQHFIPTGGIGSFFRGFARMADQLGWHLTVVLDKSPIGQAKELKSSCPWPTYVWPNRPVSYAEHNPGPFPGKETVNRFRVQNFQTALCHALAIGLPSHVLINTPEAVIAANQLGLPAQVPTTFYTHHENLVVPPNQSSKVFDQSYNDFIDSVPAMPGITTATQCKFNLVRMARLEFSRPPLVLPMPIPEPALMEPYAGPRIGVLFIGRHEKRKDPELFAKVVAEAGLPAKVLTNKRGITKFERTFQKVGLADYDIRGQIIGSPKVDFIRSAKVAFHTARLESYGFSAMESLAAGLPTLLIEERGWWQAFENDGVLKTSRDNAVDALRALYEQAHTPTSNCWKKLEMNTFRRWRSYLSVPSISQAQLEALGPNSMA